MNFEKPVDRPNEIVFINKVESDPALPRYKEGTGRAASVACSHFVQSLNAMEQGLVPYALKWQSACARGILPPQEAMTAREGVVREAQCMLVLKKLQCGCSNTIVSSYFGTPMGRFWSRQI